MIKKIFKKLGIALVGLSLLANVALAQVGGGVAYPNYVKLTGGVNVVPVRTTYELGSPTVPWANFYATAATIGTVTLNGTTNTLVIAEGTAPSATANFGKVYVKSSDSLLYFKDDAGNEYNLTGSSSIAGLITFTSGAAVTAGSYQIGRDNDATNQLHFNIPTGAAMEFSVNDVRRMTLDANGRLAIGTAAGDTQLHVVGAHAANRGLVYVDSTDHGYVGINGAAASQQGFFFMKAGTAEWLQGIPGNATGDRIHFAEGNDLTSNVRLSIEAGGNIGFGVADPTAFTHFVQVVQTSGSPNGLLFTGAAHTTLTASTEAIDWNVNLARTVQFATGALATQRAVVFQAPTYGFVGASTLTSAATVAITGAPVAGTNATLTNTSALWLQAGTLRMEDYVRWGSGTAVVGADYSVGRNAGTNMVINTPTGATTIISVNGSTVGTFGASALTMAAAKNIVVPTNQWVYYGGTEDGTSLRIGGALTQTNDTTAMITVPSGTRTLMMIEDSDTGTDFAHTVQTNPTFFIQSSDATTIADWIGFYHDQTDGVVETGGGALKLRPAGDIVNFDAGTGTGQLTLDGSTGGCWMIRDTDDAGWTEVDALDGVLTASIDADGLCD